MTLPSEEHPLNPMRLESLIEALAACGKEAPEIGPNGWETVKACALKTREAISTESVDDALLLNFGYRLTRNTITSYGGLDVIEDHVTWSGGPVLKLYAGLPARAISAICYQYICGISAGVERGREAAFADVRKLIGVTP